MRRSLPSRAEIATKDEIFAATMTYAHALGQFGPEW